MSSVANVIDDAEKIAAELVPGGANLPEIVGTLILHVEKLAGGELERLTEKELGIEPPPAPAAEVSAESASAEQEKIKELEAQLAAEKAKAGGGS